MISGVKKARTVIVTKIVKYTTMLLSLLPFANKYTNASRTPHKAKMRTFPKCEAAKAIRLLIADIPAKVCEFYLQTLAPNLLNPVKS